MTEPVVTPQQAFLIYSMAFGADADAREPKQSVSGLDKRAREGLVRAGLIRTEVRKSARGSRATHLILSPSGYDWAATHLGTKLMKTARATQLLERLLARLRGVIGADGAALKLFADGAPPPAEMSMRGGAAATPRKIDAPVETRIRDAYLSLTQGASKKRVLLKDLRPRLDAPRQAVDAALLAMQEQRVLVLMKLDNPSELTPADDAAALHIAGHPRHLLYFQA